VTPAERRRQRAAALRHRARALERELAAAREELRAAERDAEVVAPCPPETPADAGKEERR